MISWTARLRWFVLLLMSSGLLLVGCGKGGPPQFNLSGKATYGGQPIPAGSLTLIPDSAQGNKGPASSVQIRNGAYDSQPENAGHFGGAYTVRITALDGNVSDEMPMGTPLFPDYEFQLDLPTEDSTHDFDVPLDWVPKRLAPVTDHGA
jgi:hypothetical protein